MGKWLGGNVTAAEADDLAHQANVAGKTLNSTRSSYGGTTAAAIKSVETARKALDDPFSTPEIIQAAKETLADPRIRETIRSAYRSALEQAPEKLAAKDAAESAYGAAKEAATPEALAEASRASLADPTKKLRSKIPYFTNKLLPWAAAGLGSAVGFPKTGLVLGGFATLSGHGGTVVHNLMKDPATRRAAWSAVEYAITNTPEALGKFGPFIAREYARDPEHARAVDEALTAEDPDYAARKLQLLQGGSP